MIKRCEKSSSEFKTSRGFDDLTLSNGRYQSQIFLDWTEKKLNLNVDCLMVVALSGGSKVELKYASTAL